MLIFEEESLECYKEKGKTAFLSLLFLQNVQFDSAVFGRDAREMFPTNRVSWEHYVRLDVLVVVACTVEKTICLFVCFPLQPLRAECLEIS